MEKNQAIFEVQSYSKFSRSKLCPFQSWVVRSWVIRSWDFRSWVVRSSVVRSSVVRSCVVRSWVIRSSVVQSSVRESFFGRKYMNEKTYSTRVISWKKKILFIQPYAFKIQFESTICSIGKTKSTSAIAFDCQHLEYNQCYFFILKMYLFTIQNVLVMYSIYLNTTLLLSPVPLWWS